MSVEILKTGILDTVQDGGRYGYQHFGINPGGAMDLVAAELANWLVDNDEASPVIELHFPASVFKFNDDHLIAITGGNFEPEVDGQPVPINTSILVSKDSVLQFKKYKEGARAYLAINGKWEVDLWLNSYSTNLKVKAGGYKGRALLKGDSIEITGSKWKAASARNTTVILPVTASHTFSSEKHTIIRCTRGGEYTWLSDGSKALLTENDFAITPNSDRMGYRLRGLSLKSNKNEQLLSSAVIRGTVQLLPSGQLIILMADHQTTGGYAKVAQVICADLSKIAQMRANEKVRFKYVSLEEAERALIAQHIHLQNQEVKISSQLKKLMPE